MSDCVSFHSLSSSVVIETLFDKDWRRDGSVDQSTGCFSRGPWFNTQHSYGSSQLSLSPGPGELTLSYRHTFRQNTNAHEVKRNKLCVCFLTGFPMFVSRCLTHPDSEYCSSLRNVSHNLKHLKTWSLCGGAV